MRPHDQPLAAQIHKALATYEQRVQSLAVLAQPGFRDALVDQLIESVRRQRYIAACLRRPVSPLRADPASPLFDPVKAAIHHIRKGDHDEACWLVFLFVQFGRHRTRGWGYCRSFYGRLGGDTRWDWKSVTSDVDGVARWLLEHSADMGRAGGGFGNHRKYEKLAHTGRTIASYVEWVGPARSHALRFGEAKRIAGGDPKEAFDLLFRSMRSVFRFGRTARFDYLAMISKLGLAEIIPAHAYLRDATGPLAGARLLFGQPSASAAVLEESVDQLAQWVNLGFDVLEDGLCNWQKSPGEFKPFRG